MPITTIEQVIDLYRSVYYLRDQDTDMIPLIHAIILQSKLDGKPIGVWLVGGSSAGKTCLLNAFGGVSFVREVSMLTENTLLSGANVKGGEASLLLKKELKNGAVITFKDFTTILSLNEKTRAAIMGQFRQVFDGHITKETGTGKSLEWRGKINLIAGVTEVIHVQREEFDRMGSRNVFYTFPDLNDEERKATTRRALKNTGKIRKLELEVMNGFTEYIMGTLARIQNEKVAYELPEDLLEEIVDLSNFVARAVTAVARDYRKEMELMLSPNLPMRFAEQSASLGTTFMAMNNGVMPEYGKRLIFKTLIDSISKQRLMCLRMMAKYREITSRGMSIALGYEIDLVNSWMADLDALKICKRITHSEAGRVRWILKEEYRQIMCKYDGVKYLDEMYTGSERTQTLDEWMDDGEIEADIPPYEEEPKEQEMFKGM